MNQHLANALRNGADWIEDVWSSHLHKQVGGISVSEGWRFLKGYHELLAQIEDTLEGEYLFLKCEGHVSTHPEHIKSYFYKKTHGGGLDVNKELVELTKNQPELGIKERRAENYSSSYKALIKTIGYKKERKKHGEIISIQDAIGKMIPQMRDTAKAMGRKGVELTAWMKRKLQPFGITIDDQRVTWYGLIGIHNDQYAHLLDIVIRFGEKAQNTLGSRMNEHPFLVALCAALPDLRSIQRELLKDMDRGNVETTRFFEEVNVTPEWLNYGLQKALNLLT